MEQAGAKQARAVPAPSSGYQSARWPAQPTQRQPQGSDHVSKGCSSTKPIYHLNDALRRTLVMNENTACLLPQVLIFQHVVDQHIAGSTIQLLIARHATDHRRAGK